MIPQNYAGRPLWEEWKEEEWNREEREEGKTGRKKAPTRIFLPDTRLLFMLMPIHDPVRIADQ